MIRRLTIEDANLLREAWQWDESRPSWFKQMDNVFNSGTVDDLVAQVEKSAFIGIFSPQLSAIIIVEQHAGGSYEAHLMAQRGVDPAVIIAVGQQLIYDMLDYGLSEAVVWIAEKNRSIRKLCANIGFQPDGVTMYKGAYRGRVIKWLRYSIQREQLITSKAA